MKSIFKAVKFVNIVVIMAIVVVAVTILASCSLFKHDSIIGKIEDIIRSLKLSDQRKHGQRR